MRKLLASITCCLALFMPTAGQADPTPSGGVFQDVPLAAVGGLYHLGSGGEQSHAYLFGIWKNGTHDSFSGTKFVVHRFRDQRIPGLVSDGVEEVVLDSDSLQVLGDGSLRILAELPESGLWDVTITSGYRTDGLGVTWALGSAYLEARDGETLSDNTNYGDISGSIDGRSITGSYRFLLYGAMKTGVFNYSHI